LICYHFLREFLLRLAFAFEEVLEACFAAAMGDLAAPLLRDADEVRLAALLFSDRDVACLLAVCPIF